MSDFLERLQKNEPISTSASQLPEFVGLMTAFSGQTGDFSMFAPGQFDQSESIQSISFVTDFVMKRLKHNLRAGQKSTPKSSNYIIGDAKTPYRITIEGSTYIGATKREILDQIGRLQNGESLQQETIYVGYLTSKNGQPLAEPVAVWFVNRGTQMYNLGQALEVNGGLSARTVITASANHQSVVNAQGGTTQLLDFSIRQLDDNQLVGFANWADSKGLPAWFEKYRQEMFEASEEIASAPINAPVVNAYQQTPPATNTYGQAAQPVLQVAGQLNTTIPYQAGATQTVANDTRVPQNEPYIPSNAKPSGQPTAPNPWGQTNSQIEISDADLPF